MLAALGWGLGPIAFIISLPVNGLLLAATWGWFVAPITGAREISVAEGFGLGIFIGVAGLMVTAPFKSGILTKTPMIPKSSR